MPRTQAGLPGPAAMNTLIFSLLAVTLLATGCVTSRPDDSMPDGADRTLSGTVTTLPRVALPSDAAIHVRLLDAGGAPSETLAEQTIPAPGVPVPFALAVDAGRIDSAHRYIIRADVRGHTGALLWTTDTAVPVLTHGAPSSDVEVRLIQVQDETVGATVGALIGPTWRVRQIDEPSEVRRTLDGPEPYTLRLEPDGRYSGRIDCNVTGGAFEAHADGAIDLEPGPTTLAACPEGSASGDVLRVLAQVGRYAVSDDRLELSGEAGALVLERDGGRGGMPPQETLRDYAYTCESPDGPFTFHIRTGPGEIALWLPARFEGRDGGTYRVLGQVRAASGAKYQDGPVTVWTKGADQALLEVDGETFRACRS